MTTRCFCFTWICLWWCTLTAQPARERRWLSLLVCRCSRQGASSATIGIEQRARHIMPQWCRFERNCTTSIITLMNRAERRSRNAVCNCDFVGLFWKEKSQERDILRCSSRFEAKQSLEQSKYGSRQSVLEMTKTTTCTAVAAARGEKYIDRVSWVYIVKVWETYTTKCGHKCTIQYIK